LTLLDSSSDVRVSNSGLDHHSLNAMLNLYDKKGQIQFDADKKAAKHYIINNVNANLVNFDSLEDKLESLFEEDYYEREVFEQYSFAEIKALYKHVYAKKFRFPTYYGALKFYTSYALKTKDGKRYLERFEDRVAATALYLARGDAQRATEFADSIIDLKYQPATPTILNAGKKARGELVSCFLVRDEDNMESIARGTNAVLQLSKRGGGVAVSLTNLREQGAPIKGVEDQSSGLIPVAKIIEDAVTYSNQLGQRDGSAAIYLSAHHPDVLDILDAKRENANPRIRLNRLSVGLVITDVIMDKFRKDEDFYTFSPYDVAREMGRAMSEVSINEEYDNLMANPRIKKTAINARKFMKTIAEVQFESGYPYLMFEDTVNAAHNLDGRISMSNLCSEILQQSTPSTYNEDLSYDEMGTDISCNLGSMNIANVMKSGDIGATVNAGIRMLSAVSDLSNVNSVPSIAKGNRGTHAIGLGQMNLHGFLAEQGVLYGSPESVDFVSTYFAAVAYYAVKASNEIAIERGERFEGFENSKYATGEYFEKYVTQDWYPETEVGKALFNKFGVYLPTMTDWIKLKNSVRKNGIYNGYLQAVPPTGSISYINHATSSIHPIVALIEARKEGKTGRAYYPAYGLTNDNKEFYQDAYEIGARKIIDVYAAATTHVDQGLSCTLFFTDEATTKTINMAQNYAHSKGIKTLYYMRFRQNVIDGTDVEGCVSCAL
jgi:ribonucleoside-diphosphate reductase alpha chain